MAREFEGPLSAEDVAWLRSRYSLSYVDSQIALLGLAKGEDTSKEAKAKAKAEKERVEAEAKAERERAEEAERARLAAEQGATGDSGQGDPDGAGEDLIGSPAYDVLAATENEVKEWVANATDDEKAAALATEQAREDRDPRKGVVSLLS